MTNNNSKDNDNLNVTNKYLLDNYSNQNNSSLNQSDNNHQTTLNNISFICDKSNKNKNRLSSSSITTNSSSNRQLISSSSSFGNDFEFKTNKNDDNEQKHEGERSNKARNRTRFDVALLGLAIAAVNCYAQATFCIAIVEMVLPADFLIKDSDLIINNNYNDSAIKLGLASTTKSAATLTDLPINLIENNLDQSCPIEYKYKDYYDSWRFPENNNSSKTFYDQQQSSSNNNKSNSNNNNVDISNRFNWDASQQGLLLGAFAIGTAPLQVVAGRLAEIYGAKWVLLIGCIGTAATNLTIPFLAHYSFILLLLNRVLMGIAQAGMEPGLMCLLAKWLTPEEAGLYISMLLFAMCIGFFLGSLCSSFILSIGYGWPLAYYVSGGLNLIIAIVWIVYANSRPEESKIISKEELFYIKSSQQEKVLNNNNSVATTTSCCANNNQDDNNKDLTINYKNSINYSSNINCDKIKHKCENNNQSSSHNDNKLQQEVQTRSSSAPWLKILSTRSVWAFIICKFSIRWCADVLSIELPTYLANVLHLSIRLNGILNSVSSALFAIFSFLAGYIANEILIKQQKRFDENLISSNNHNNDKRRKQKFVLTKTNLRKIMQSIASFGSAITIFLMTKYDCNIIISMSMLLILSCCLVMGTGGELQIPYDMTPKYPGTLHGMACTMSVSGWFAPPMIGLILADQPNSRHRWSIVWYLTGFINLFGGLVFVLFADASPRDFDNNENNTDNRDNNDNTASERKLPAHHYKVGDKVILQAAAMNSCNLFNIKTSNQVEEKWSPFFDRELIKIRQVEDSYIKRPSYLNDFDSIVTHNESVIYPYKVFDNNQQLVETFPAATLNGAALGQQQQQQEEVENYQKTKKSGNNQTSVNFLQPFGFWLNKQKSKFSNKTKINLISSTNLIDGVYCLESQKTKKRQQNSTSSSSLCSSQLSNINSDNFEQQQRLQNINDKSSLSCHDELIDQPKGEQFQTSMHVDNLTQQQQQSTNRKDNVLNKSQSSDIINKTKINETKTITHL